MFTVVAETVTALLQQKQNQNMAYLFQYQTGAIALSSQKTTIQSLNIKTNQNINI
jgi:hypothetical protein